MINVATLVPSVEPVPVCPTVLVRARVLKVGLLFFVSLEALVVELVVSCPILIAACKLVGRVM